MWKSLPVTKGDKVTVEVYGKYVSPPTNNNISLIPFINPLPATMPASEGNNNPTWLRAGLIAFPVSYSTSPSVPKSYLRGQLFDKEGNFVRAVPVVPLSSGSAWQLMSFDFEAEIEGTLQIFVANESDKSVWFDDLNITHEQHLIAQENHYYPFGMNMVGIEKRGRPENLWQFQGQEKIKDFNLNWSSFKWRNADVQLGRFFSIDPLAEDYLYNSVYAFSENKVVAHIELEGLEAVPAEVREFGRYVENGFNQFTSNVKKSYNSFVNFIFSSETKSVVDKSGKVANTSGDILKSQSKTEKLAGNLDKAGELDKAGKVVDKTGTILTVIEVIIDFFKTDFDDPEQKSTFIENTVQEVIEETPLTGSGLGIIMDNAKKEDGIANPKNKQLQSSYEQSYKQNQDLLKKLLENQNKKKE